MRFQVPQFIDIEDKIFGPFTFKQFIYLLGGAGGSYLLYRILPIFIAAPIIMALISLSLALTFYKVNGRPFPEVLQYSIYYFFRSKLFVWKQQKTKIDKPEDIKKIEAQKEAIPRLTESKLKDLAWSLDVLDNDKINRK